MRIILYHSTQGFVSAKWFDSAAERDATWDRLCAEIEALEEDDA